MKFDCGETFAEKRERLERWHRWFAWRPVQVGEHDCRWWEVVERKGTAHHDFSGDTYWSFQYRAWGQRA